MRTPWSFVAFLAVFLSIYGGMNAYALLRLAGLLAVKKKLLLWLLVGVLTVSFVVATWLEWRFGTKLARIIYVAAGTWMGVLLLLCSTLLVYEVVRFVLPCQPRTAAKVIIAVAALLSIYALINARRLEVRRIAIPAPVELTIAQLSDIHLGSISAATFERMIDRTNALDPDVVVVTGDLLDNLNEKTVAAVKLVDKLPMPVFFVTGNHEDYVGVDKVMLLLKETKVKPLRNEVVNFNGIQIVGVDHNFNHSHLADRLEDMEIEPARFNLLLYHRPANMESAVAEGIDLMLSGHTHHGQIFPFNFVVALFQRPVKGLHRIGSGQLYVSPGSGYWGPPLRLGSRCEITLFNLGPDIEN